MAQTRTDGSNGCCSGPTTTLDPVCGMTVDPATTAHHATHDGHDYHFCSASCRTKFIADPGRYLSDIPRPIVQAAAGAI